MHLDDDSSFLVRMSFIPKAASIAKGIVSIIPERVLMIPIAEIVRKTVIAITATLDDRNFAKSGNEVPL
jgi:hypothetical protein